MKSPRRASRRPPFTLALIGLVVVFTGLTGAVIGGRAWREQRARSRALVDAAMTQAARLTAAHATRVLDDAESTARLGPALVAQGQLDPADDRALERFVLGVLRAQPTLSWVSYGDRNDRFVGAYFAVMTPVIVQHGGVIDEIIGDAIFVLFGAPFGRPDDAERSVRCAWAMQERWAPSTRTAAAAGRPS